MNITEAQETQGVVTHSVTPPKSNQRRKTRRRTYIPRQTRKFQLRRDHAEDMHVGAILDYARTKRQEVTIIRQGVALEYSLQQGDTSILLERYPWLLEALKPLIAPPQPSGGGGLEEIKSMLEIALANQQANNGYTMASQPVQQPLPGLQPMTGQPATTGKTLGGFKALEAPNWDDDDDLPEFNTIQSAAVIDLTANLLNAVKGLLH